ncbi:hypothetical protein GPA19_02725 [Azoarcus indigens]|uniref:Uncharacterized protein involved in cysteine biosynthesis n=1 Tax=Azoarcus indigens TaxID=29545 RepID=A0A4R6E8I5_9RHOO|nr:EI24 domain-containing protein [Azoarcus indigens]NMG63861.1 hypothetical protein [Azoarcus indigens]TDN53864.1 uncharacterized protein involved in cysteine biosynthesis [Azoarcus indigens]
MRDILLAFGRALRSLARRDIFWHLVWPGIAAALVWLVIAIFSWTALVAAVMGWIEGWALIGGWLNGSEVFAAVTLIMVKITIALAFVPLVYLTAALLVAAIALPMMLERVAKRDYIDLELRRGGSNLGSAWNAVLASALFLAGLLISLPFWLIPGVGLLASVLLTGWLNQRAFGYDALMLHADGEEMRRLRTTQRMPMLVLGGCCALLAYIPVVNLVAPAFSGLAFVHLMLETLRRERLRNGVTLLDPEPDISTLPERL